MSCKALCRNPCVVPYELEPAAAPESDEQENAIMSIRSSNRAKPYVSPAPGRLAKFWP